MENGRIVEKGNVIDIFSEPKEDITKNFVKTVIQDEVPEKLMQSIYEDTRNYKLLRLKFLSSDSTESVLAQVNKKFDIETNILFANISEIQERILGIHIVQILGTDDEIRRAENYFTLHGVEYKELDENKELLREVG